MEGIHASVEDSDEKVYMSGDQNSADLSSPT